MFNHNHTGNQNTPPQYLFLWKRCTWCCPLKRRKFVAKIPRNTGGLWVNQRKTVLDIDVCRWGDHAPRIHRLSAHSAPFIGDMLWGNAPKEKHRYFIFTQVVVTSKKKKKNHASFLLRFPMDAELSTVFQHYCQVSRENGPRSATKPWWGKSLWCLVRARQRSMWSRSGPRLGEAQTGVTTHPLAVGKSSLLKKSTLESTRAAHGKHVF